MPLSALTGTRLRERRLALGLRQAELAERAQISASYLNLIEHNRRPVADDLLVRLAALLGQAPEALRQGADGALVDALRAAAAERADLAAEVASAEDFAARFPGWAAVLADLYRQTRALGRAVEELNDRMTHDPHLSASLHEMLSAVSAVRSTAGILAETEDIEPDWRARFHRNLQQDSERLAMGAEALVAYLDGAGQDREQGIASPQEEVEAWATARGWALTGPEAAAGAASLASGAARQMAAALVAQAEADAAAYPEEAFQAALARLGPDPLALADHFGADVLAAFRRVALRPGASPGLVTCDASGTLVLRKPTGQFALPRFGSACPLWPLFAALVRPQVAIDRQIRLAGPQATRFQVRAWCETRHPAGYRGPELREAAMLILPAPPVGGAAPVLPVGPTCRICPQPDCAARREPSIISG